MDKKPFADKTTKPNDDTLAKVLGVINPLYKELNELTFKFKKE